MEELANVNPANARAEATKAGRNHDEMIDRIESEFAEAREGLKTASNQREKTDQLSMELIRARQDLARDQLELDERKQTIDRLKTELTQV